MIKIEKIIPGGQALGTDESGKKIFFWNALPDEIVTDYKVTKNKSHYKEAIALKIEQPSHFRISPKDACYLSTSPWQIMDFNYELELKSQLVKDIFQGQKIPILSPTVITDQKSYFYRNKMEYSLYWDNNSNDIKLAFHARGSHQKIPISKSSIEHPEIFNAATEIIRELNLKNERAADYQSILLRSNQSGEVSGGLFKKGEPHPTFSPLSDTILGKSYTYSPNGFFQINLPVYELALQEIKQHIKTAKVLDLYSGVGTIGLSVAADKELTLVECDRSAYNESLRNAKDFKNVKSVLSKSEDVLNYIEPDTTIILDPPRAGCDRKLLNRIIEVKPNRIIYLSCNPITQARDLSYLLPVYNIDLVKAFNFFPRTPHIENLVILSYNI